MTTNSHQVNDYLGISDEAGESKKAQFAREAEVMLSVNGEVWLGLRRSPDDLELMAQVFNLKSLLLKQSTKSARSKYVRTKRISMSG